MANNVNQTQEINYISQKRKIIVGRNNTPVENLIHFDYRITDTFSFSVVNAINQIVNIGGKSYQIFGSLIDSKGELHIIFYTNSYTIQDNVLTFVIDTYTNQYLELIKNNDKEIDLTIVAHKGEGSEVVLRDRALASPRPYIAGRDPLLILYSKVYTGDIPISGEFGAGTDLDLVVGSQSFALGEGLITNDTNQIVFGQYNTPDATKVLIVGGGTSSSNRANIFSIDEAGNIEANAVSANALYISGQPFDPGEGGKTYTGASGIAVDNENNIISLSGDVGKTYTAGTGIAISDQDVISLTASIPSAISQITNDVGFVTSSDIPTYTAGEGIAISNENVISLTATIPLSTSQLTNNSDFITSGQVDTKIATATTNMATTGWVTEQGYLTAHQSLTAYATSAQIDAEYAKKTDVPTYTAGTGIGITSNVISLTATIPLSTSQLTNNSNFLSAITVEDENGTSESVTGIVLNSENIYFYKQDGKAYMDWTGLNVYGNGVADVRFSSMGFAYNDFVLDEGDGYVEISLNSSALPQINNINKVKSVASSVIEYDKDFDIIKNTAPQVSNQGSLLMVYPVASGSIIDALETGDVATFEYWAVPQSSISGISIETGITLIGELPESVTANATQVFTIRVIKTGSNSVSQYISYAYEF